MEMQKPRILLETDISAAARLNSNVREIKGKLRTFEAFKVSELDILLMKLLTS